MCHLVASGSHIKIRYEVSCLFSLWFTWGVHAQEETWPLWQEVHGVQNNLVWDV